jgi:hypothetical protein
MDNLEINVTLGTRHRTKTNKAKQKHKTNTKNKQNKKTKYTKAKHWKLRSTNLTKNGGEPCGREEKACPAFLKTPVLFI